MGKIKMLFKNVYVLIFMLVFASTFIFLIILNKKAMPAIMNYASVQTKRVGIEVLRSTGTKEVNKLLNDSNLFITNKNEAELMYTRPDLFAQGLYNGIITYFE